MSIQVQVQVTLNVNTNQRMVAEVIQPKNLHMELLFSKKRAVLIDSSPSSIFYMGSVLDIEFIEVVGGSQFIYDR